MLGLPFSGVKTLSEYLADGASTSYNYLLVSTVWTTPTQPPKLIEKTFVLSDIEEFIRNN
jgi:hypothetical protein